MVSELEIAVWQRIFAKFPTQTNRDIILQIREFLGGIRECDVDRQ
jgi:hypothetical protein